jgi:small subunit ribosomal protein S6
VKQKYETIVIFDGSLSEETIRKENAAFEEFLKVNSEFEKVDVWGKKNLAYPINKKKTGVYHLYNYLDQSEKNIAGKIEKFFKLNDAVIRHLTVIRVEQPVNERKTLHVQADAEKAAEMEVK